VVRVNERVPASVDGTPVERADIEVMFLRTADEIDEMKRGWQRLEGLVGLRGRRFSGAFDPLTREYRVCVQMREGDDPAAAGLESGTLPGGRYLRARLRGEPPEVYDRIGPTFAALQERAHPDNTRPWIESYRRRDEVDLLLPVHESPEATS
jgi:hypothetical protein